MTSLESGTEKKNSVHVCTYQWQVLEDFLKQIGELDVILGFHFSVKSIHLVHGGGFMIAASQIHSLYKRREFYVMLEKLSIRKHEEHPLYDKTHLRIETLVSK